jgi:hypothetical protein
MSAAQPVMSDLWLFLWFLYNGVLYSLSFEYVMNDALYMKIQR